MAKFTRQGAEQHYKIDFTDTRLQTEIDLLHGVTAVFDVSQGTVLSFRVARIDFAVDVYKVPIDWFRRNCYVRFKRTVDEYETVHSETLRGVTTLKFGKGRDFYRIYDKVAEKVAHKREVIYLGHSRELPPPLRTRVERQCRGSAIPALLRTLGSFLQNAATFDPFDKMVCREGGQIMTGCDDWKPQRWLMNLGLLTAVKLCGEAEVRARLNRSGNAQRTFAKYSDVLNSRRKGPTREQLRDAYQHGSSNPSLHRSGWENTVPVGGISFLA